MSKGPLLWGYYGSAISGGALFALALALLADSGGELGAPIAVLVLALAVLLIGPAVVLGIAVHRSWAALPPEHARTTPGRAVGLLFVPFFNLYWVFQAFHGFAQDYNRYVEGRDRAVPRLSEGLYLAFCIVAVLSAIPYVGVLGGLVNLVLVGLVLSQSCEAVTALRGDGGRGVGEELGSGGVPVDLAQARTFADALAGSPRRVLLLAVAMLLSDGLALLGASARMAYLGVELPTGFHASGVLAAILRSLAFALLVAALRPRWALVLVWIVVSMAVGVVRQVAWALLEHAWPSQIETALSGGIDWSVWLRWEGLPPMALWPAITMTLLVIAVARWGVRLSTLAVASVCGHVVAHVVVSARFWTFDVPAVALAAVYGLVDGWCLYAGLALFRGGSADQDGLRRELT